MAMKIAKEFGQRLQGEPKGRRAFAAASEKLGGRKAGELVTLDFSDVLIVTASWISAMLLPLYRWAADEQVDLFFEIVYGPDLDWLDDLRLVARHNRRFFLIRPSSGKKRVLTLIGPMDEAERRTLQKVADLGEATGAILERESPEEKIRATGWNNRLKELYEKRVLRRSKRGREQVYSLVEGGMTIDGA
jgi:hypothetical protein